MPGAFRIHGPVEPNHVPVESALLTGGTLILTILTIVILLLVVFATRAS